MPSTSIALKMTRAQSRRRRSPHDATNITSERRKVATKMREHESRRGWELSRSGGILEHTVDLIERHESDHQILKSTDKRRKSAEYNEDPSNHCDEGRSRRNLRISWIGSSHGADPYRGGLTNRA